MKARETRRQELAEASVKRSIPVVEPEKEVRKRFRSTLLRHVVSRLVLYWFHVESYTKSFAGVACLESDEIKGTAASPQRRFLVKLLATFLTDLVDVQS
jgi:hypothetical protein